MADVLGARGLRLAGCMGSHNAVGSTFHLCYRQRSKNRKVMQQGCSEPPSTRPMPRSPLVVILT